MSPASDSMGVRLVVHGRVQGVGFRYAAVEVARRLGVAGWARNQADGTVEIVAAGAAPAVRGLVDWCHRGPPSARVTDVEEQPLADALPSGGFGVRW
jgi:acylphosphatase